MTTKEKAKIIAKAELAGIAASEYMISAALDHKVICIDGLPEIISELKGIGRNLNQLLTLCNMGRVSSANLSECMETLANIHSRLMALTEVI